MRVSGSKIGPCVQRGTEFMAEGRADRARRSPALWPGMGHFTGVAIYALKDIEHTEV